MSPTPSGMHITNFDPLWDLTGGIASSVGGGTSGIGGAVTTTNPGSVAVGGSPPAGGGVVSDGGSGGSWAPVPGLGPMRDQPRGLALSDLGAVLSVGAGGTWDAQVVERPFVWFDSTANRYGMLYEGIDGSGVLKIGLAWANVPEGPWTKDAANPILAGSGMVGAPDKDGVQSPTLWVEGGTYYLFYSGIVGAWGAGIRTYCLASATSIYGPWKRLGALWTSSSKWYLRSSLVKLGGIYYLFFADRSSAYVATAPSVTGPYTVQSVPLFSATAAWEANYVEDLQVLVFGDSLWMAYAGAEGDGANGYPDERFTQDGYAVAAISDIIGNVNLANWTKHSQNPIWTAGGQPTLLQVPGWLYHYYTPATGTRNINLAVSPTPTTSLATGDHKVLVDGSDTTAAYLSSKLVAGSGVTLTIENPGANEDIRIAANARTFSFFMGG